MGREYKNICKLTCDLCGLLSVHEEPYIPDPYENEQWYPVEDKLLCYNCFKSSFLIIPLQSHLKWDGIIGDLMLKESEIMENKVMIGIAARDNEVTYLTKNGVEELHMYLTAVLERWN